MSWKRVEELRRKEVTQLRQVELLLLATIGAAAWSAVAVKSLEMAVPVVALGLLGPVLVWNMARRVKEEFVIGVDADSVALQPAFRRHEVVVLNHTKGQSPAWLRARAQVAFQVSKYGLPDGDGGGLTVWGKRLGFSIN